MSEDGPACRHCGSDMDFEECETCGGDGETAYGELAERDPLWYDEEDTEPCQACDGRGGAWRCGACGKYAVKGAAMPTDEPRRPSARATALVDEDEVASAEVVRAEQWVARVPLSPRSRELAWRNLEDALARYQATRAALLAYLADLEETVDWYADPAHYGDSAKRIVTPDGIFANVCSVLADGGARARAVPQ